LATGQFGADDIAIVQELFLLDTGATYIAGLVATANAIIEDVIRSHDFVRNPGDMLSPEIMTLVSSEIIPKVVKMDDEDAQAISQNLVFKMILFCAERNEPHFPLRVFNLRERDNEQLEEIMFEKNERYRHRKSEWEHRKQQASAREESKREAHAFASADKARFGQSPPGYQRSVEQPVQQTPPRKDPPPRYHPPTLPHRRPPHVPTTVRNYAPAVGPQHSAWDAQSRKRQKELSHAGPVWSPSKRPKSEKGKTKARTRIPW
jgi:hypothetical protein